MKKIILATITITAAAVLVYASTLEEKQEVEVKAAPVKVEAPIILAKAEIPVAKAMTEVTEIEKEAPILLAKAQTPVAKVMEEVTKIKEEVKTQVVSVTKKVTQTTLEEKQSLRESSLASELAKKETQRIENTKAREARLQKLDTDLQAKADLRASVTY